MNRLASAICWFYSQLLRLYPPHFRAEFADEMSTVFGQALQESKNTLSLVGLLAGELHDLPVNLLREHVRERRAHAITNLMQETIMAETVFPMRAFRGLTWTLLTIFVLYCLLILLPFFYHGLNLLSWDALTSGLYDPKGYSPFAYEGAIGIVTRILGVLVIIFGPPTIAAMGGVLGLTLRRHWHQLQQKQRFLGSAAIMGALFILGLAISPMGRALSVWFMD